MKLRMCGAVLLCAMVLVGTVSCSSSVSKAPNGMTASEILAMTNNASASMNTVQEDVTVNISSGDRTVEFNASISQSADIPNRKMYMSAIGPQGEGEWCILNNWMYISIPTAKAKWAKTPLTEDIWNTEVSYEVQELGVLNNSIDAKYIGTELVGGRNCYKINVNPNPAALSDTFNMIGVPSDVIVKSLSCTAWIDESAYYPMKTSLDMTLEYNNVTILANIVYIASNVNQPVNIVLPAAAKNATAINYSTFESGNW